jgi:PAS domain S-box-containing protein
MEIWTIWHATYWLSGTIKAITALASVPTAVLLVKLVPVALRVPSASALQSANSELAREVADRKRAEGEVRRINAELEARVAERTAQLEAANRSLLQEGCERQRAEETIRSAQHLLQAIVDNSMAVIYVKDLAGRYLLVNRRYEDIFHLTREAILGRTDHDLFPKAAADAFRAMDERVALAGQALTEEETVPQVDGAHTYLSVKFPLQDVTGRLYAVSGISTDITERRHAERRLRSQLAKLDLLSRTTRAIGERQDVRSILQVAIRSLEEHQSRA